MSGTPRPSAQEYEEASLLLTLVNDPALCVLLDHLAAELAQAYVRLRRGTTASDSWGNRNAGEEKTS